MAAGASFREVNEDMRLWYVLIDAAVPFYTGCVIVVQFPTKTSEVTSLFNRESLTSSTRENLMLQTALLLLQQPEQEAAMQIS